MPVSTLSQFQRDVLRAFVAREYRFFVTGGAALAGFYLGHRQTDDLDFVTLDKGIEDGARALEAVAQDLGASIEVETDSPHFKRFVLRHGAQMLKVDLMYEHSPQAFPQKAEFDGVRVDALGEILVNKLCILSRLEPRDLVDVYAIEGTGLLRVEAAVPLAVAKEGGITAGTLAASLHALVLGSDTPLPRGVSRSELDAYRHDLIDRLTRLAFPAPR